MQLKASVWKPSKSVVEIADEFELRGHIQSSRLIYFLYVYVTLLLITFTHQIRHFEMYIFTY